MHESSVYKFFKNLADVPEVLPGQIWWHSFLLKLVITVRKGLKVYARSLQGQC